MANDIFFIRLHFADADTHKYLFKKKSENEAKQRESGRDRIMISINADRKKFFCNFHQALFFFSVGIMLNNFIILCIRSMTLQRTTKDHFRIVDIFNSILLFGIRQHVHLLQSLEIIAIIMNKKKKKT